MLLHKPPTPVDDRLSWQHLLAQCKLGNSKGRRNVRSARTTVGMLTAIAAIFLRPGWCNVLRAPKYNFLLHPSSGVSHAHALMSAQRIITGTTHQLQSRSGPRGAQKTTLSSCVLSHHSVLFRVPKVLSSSSCSFASSTKTWDRQRERMHHAACRNCLSRIHAESLIRIGSVASSPRRKFLVFWGLSSLLLPSQLTSSGQQ